MQTGPMMNENPYAAPEAEPKPALTDTAAKEVRTVSRVLRWFGVVVSVIYLAMSVSATFALLVFVIAGRTKEIIGILLPTLACWGVFYIGWTYVRVGKGLLLKKPKAYRAAMILLCLLLIGFPLFTLVGILCIVKLRNNYEDYQPPLEPVPET